MATAVDREALHAVPLAFPVCARAVIPDVLPSLREYQIGGDGAMSEGVFHYAYRSELGEWLRLGWMPRPHILAGSPLGGRSIMVEWLCDCPMVRPARLEARG